MGTTRKTISLSAQQDAWIKARIASGACSTDSDHIRDLIRRDQAQSTSFLALRLAIEDGLERGECDRTVRDIWNEAERRAGAARR